MSLLTEYIVCLRSLVIMGLLVIINEHLNSSDHIINTLHWIASSSPGLFLAIYNYNISMYIWFVLNQFSLNMKQAIVFMSIMLESIPGTSQC